MEIIFWCEFPEIADWDAIENILEEENFKTEIYLACKSRLELNTWKKIINKKCKNIINVNAWPIVDKKEGYWFSKFSYKNTIKKLKQYEGLKVKVDLEPPFPNREYSSIGLFFYGIKRMLRSKKYNEDLLKRTIKDLAKNSKLMSNEFPLPAFLSRRLAGHTDVRKINNAQINFIVYSTFVKKGRSFLRAYYSLFARWAKWIYKDKAMFSLGLIGPGIFETEPEFHNPRELVKDLKMFKNLGAKKVAIYAIERVPMRKNPNAWIKAVKKFANSSQIHT